MFIPFLALLALASFVASSPAQNRLSKRERQSAPSASVRNGTYVGRYSAEYDQEFFLGMPFAQPPVGNLRYRIPQSLKETWRDFRAATEYSKECVGYGSDQWNYETSEDCLYINVVRPAGYADEQLPVAAWIHGGGYYQGGAPDQRYNLSFIVHNSVRLERPIIAVSFNYRLNGWGFMNSQEVLDSGNANIGLRDQRLALHWVQENIGAFGGDRHQVTIWGESAGGSSVGFHLTAYSGRDDKLFRGAIMQSGNPVFYSSLDGTDFYQPLYNNITAQAGCANQTDTLQCLREVPYEKLNSILNNTEIRNSFNPTIDGDFIQNYTSLQLAAKKFVHVPILSGANSDEGTAFSPRGINTTEDFYNAITSDHVVAPAPPSLADQLLEAYPDDPSQGIPGPPTLPPDYRPANTSAGAQYRRSAAYYGDAVFIANRRLTCETWAAAHLNAWCYRFNAIPAGVPNITGATHFQEIAFVFMNTLGVGYAPAATPPFQGLPNKAKDYIQLAQDMDSSWVSFIAEGDPNAWRNNGDGDEVWPQYEIEDPKIIVWEVNTTHVEPDAFRAEGIKLINKNNANVYHR